MDPAGVFSLLDWKRRIYKLYEGVRTAPEPSAAWRHWCDTRDELFSSHEQSPIPKAQRADRLGLLYYAYRPEMRVLAEVIEAEPKVYDIATSGDKPYSFTRFGIASFGLEGEAHRLELYWLQGYGGGVFLPFRDSTSGEDTYGAGRYLLDTVKGADLGMEDGKLVLDFNFAYNPSCSYDPRWVCPLAPPPNRLEIPIEAGEKHRD